MSISRIIVVKICLLLVFSAQAQDCFDAYGKMFENGGDTLSFSEFKQRELQFIENLKGCVPPEIVKTTISNEDIILSAQQGKVVVLNFWFTTCLPCLKEIPLLNELTEVYDDSEVLFLGLARDDIPKLESFFKRFGPFKFKIIPESYDVATDYKVVGWPQSIVIDKKGQIHQIWAGAGESPEKLVDEIQQAIDECIFKN